ncbi:hypothetical protein [Sphingomonas sp. 10B4]|uniref:hypothetical protein n=1 Tax=Sphingomonas sp. 10B4 TaxID=3048575 RepID=UPI002AB5AA62|nr:hypothetical protein [Sphingomonas sp. 10B4]MDY7524564.1 hypothetical protein [Sphingomonas sp. 10B4]MEB0283982.1 hypothetical protein [Sphingomonas sp. 10B4]
MAKDIEPIDADFDAVAQRMVTPAPSFASNSSALALNAAQTPAPPAQGVLDLGIQVEKVIGGVEMGVLQNGIPYLTQTGLANVSGAARSTVFEITQEWEAAMRDGVISPRSRVAFFHDYLGKYGYSDPRLFIEISKNGSPYYAYPDVVCMAFVEYFAFEAQKTNGTALTNYRQFARFGLQQFIYQALNYAPIDPWLFHNARVSLLRNSVPVGYFSIFKESVGLTVDLINAGLTVNDHTIPDGSVGSTWANYWKAMNLAERFGPRIKYNHYYPPEFPQSASNPQEANAYPNEAWAEFQNWFRTIYLPTKYPAYILKKANMLPGGEAEAKKLAAMYQPAAIEDYRG